MTPAGRSPPACSCPTPRRRIPDLRQPVVAYGCQSQLRQPSGHGLLAHVVAPRKRGDVLYAAVEVVLDPGPWHHEAGGEVVAQRLHPCMALAGRQVPVELLGEGVVE